MKKINIIISILISTLLFSCSEDYLDQVPTSSQAVDEIKTLNDVELILNGVYNILQSASYYNGSFIMENDVRADDMASINGNRLTSTFIYDYDAESLKSGLWTVPYSAIRSTCQCLYVLENIIAETEADKTRKQDFIGQARALRALFHFDLARMFANQYALADENDLGIPVVNRVLEAFELLPRNTIGETYKFVVDELIATIPLLSTSRKDGYINAYGAKAILARVYLYMENNTEAYKLATEVIEDSPYSLISSEEYVDSWSETFTSESLLSVVNSTDDNGEGESVGNISDPASYGSFGASQDFIDLMSADQDDVRFQLMYVDFVNHPNGRILKYPGIGNTKSVIVSGVLNSESKTSSVPVIRLSEIYLIAAEAAIKNNDKANAIKYLNPIIERGNPANTIVEAEANLDRLLLERRKELVAEGHRFFDLMRNKMNVVRIKDDRMDDTENGLVTFEYTNDLAVFPIPNKEMNVNDNMVQNDGY